MKGSSSSIEEHMLECEARYWVKHIADIERISGRSRAAVEWTQIKSRLINKRGQEAVNKLVEKMNECRSKQNTQNKKP